MAASNLTIYNLSKDRNSAKVIYSKPPDYAVLYPKPPDYTVQSTEPVNCSTTHTQIHQPQSTYNINSSSSSNNLNQNIIQSTNEISSYKTWSIINIFCCCNICFGCLALYYSIETKYLKKEGLMQDALKTSMVARNINIVATMTGEAALANYKFAQQTSHSTLPITIAFSIGVYAALMIAGPISGAHINPAVTISLMTIGLVKPLQCMFYIIGQILGAFLGAALVYLVYLNQFNKFDGGIRQMTGPNGTADIFFTMPSDGVPHWNTFLDQLIIAAILMIFIMALTRDFNHMTSEVTKPFAFVLIIIGITCAFSINAGAALNPARDFGPRLFGSFIYGRSDVFSIDNYFFFIPISGPILGAIAGVWIHQGFTYIVKNYGDPRITDRVDLAAIRQKL
ncbi:unnamed protein product [Adineta steineri]|uniref:Uncharacterized protein n=1 Tax=Adineta steineri TaxID=433720 RepID=A0A813VDW0_9BILA|nr:unnamed protein product [Adineta steineri]CAF1123825.1 unnamed protein product [Adineta steineri]